MEQTHVLFNYTLTIEIRGTTTHTRKSCDPDRAD